MLSQSPGAHGEVASRVKAIIGRSEGLFSVDIQNLVFYADCKAVEKHNGRFTDFEFKPMMYGAHSEGLSDMIKDLSESVDGIFTETAIRDGTTDRKYSYVGRIDIHPEVGSFVDSVIEETKQYDTSEMTRISKENYLYNQASRGESLSFPSYREALEEDSELHSVTGSYKPDPCQPDWVFPLSQ